MWTVIASLLVLSPGVGQPPRQGWVIDISGQTVIGQVQPDLSRQDRFVWRVLSTAGSVLSERPEPKTQAGFEFTYGECTESGHLRPDVIAEIKTSPAAPGALEIHRVWALDPATWVFKPARITKLVCYSADYGF